MRVPRLPIASFRHVTSSPSEKIFGAVRVAGIGALLLTSVAAVGSGCLDRPVAPATPQVAARVLTDMKQNKISKIDLLFMIDNSSSMADKQAILSQAVPDLVKRLIEPKCVDKVTGMVVGDAVNNQCTTGVLDFEPIKDIHIGIISSSLGAHGASGVCDDASDVRDKRMNPHNNDRGHLITRDKNDDTVATFGNKGFLTYNPSTMGALGTVAQVVQPFRTMVEGVGQHGCGYEASLESIYRFLIDPEPFNILEIDTSRRPTGEAKLVGIDQELLKQRADFLRPDSLVSIMIVTDENDCSVVDGDQGFYPLLSRPGGGSILGRGTSACLTNPNDACCFNCNVQETPTGCQPATNDPECTKSVATEAEDSRNLRCFNQKQKYGQSFLYPVKRYIDGFSNAKVPNRKGELVDNPLYSDLLCKPESDCQAARDKSLVLVAGITGVPWQLISKDPNTLAGGYKSAKELHDDKLWVKLVGTPGNETSAPTPPRDPHMIESVTPRIGLAGPGSGATADPIHGHEWEPSKLEGSPNSDLQYACTFALPAPKPCDLGGSDCDCTGTPTELANTKNPLCQAGADFTRNQLRAKAYPGTRILQVLEGLDPAQAIVASICPVHVDMNRIDAPDYGYTPAIQTLISRLRVLLRGQCLPRPIEVKPDGTVPCIVIEAFKSNGACACDGIPGRIKADRKLVTPIMEKSGNCFCEMQQIDDPAKADLCKTSGDPGAAAGNGWCYIDPTQGKDGQPDPRQCNLVDKCSPTERHLIKFVNSASEPRSGATAFIMCQEQAFDPSTAGQKNEVCKEK
jgi:hypothetical protein